MRSELEKFIQNDDGGLSQELCRCISFDAVRIGMDSVFFWEPLGDHAPKAIPRYPYVRSSLWSFHASQHPDGGDTG